MTDRIIDLTLEEAELLWGSRPESLKLLQSIYDKLEPGERIVGLGSRGSLKPTDQRYLVVRNGEKI